MNLVQGWSFINRCLSTQSFSALVTAGFTPLYRKHTPGRYRWGNRGTCRRGPAGPNREVRGFRRLTGEAELSQRWCVHGKVRKPAIRQWRPQPCRPAKTWLRAEPPPQFDAGHVRNGIGGTAVDLHIHDDFFNVGAVTGIRQADQIATQHGHPYPHHLPGAQMPVGRRRFLHKVSKRALRFVRAPPSLEPPAVCPAESSTRPERLDKSVALLSSHLANMFHPCVNINITECKKKGALRRRLSFA